MTSDQQLGPEVIAFARESFGFLEKGKDRAFEIDDKRWRTVLAYVVGPITIELQLDWLDSVAGLLVCRTVNGRRPPGYYMHEGKRMRMYLGKALEEIGGGDPVLAKRMRLLQGKSGPQAMKDQIEMFASTLRDKESEIPTWHQRLYPD